MKRISVFLLVVVALPSLGATEVYHWMDAEGVLHFGDIAPEGTARLTISEPNGASPIRPQPRPRARQASSRRSASVRDSRQQDRQHAEKCHRAEQGLARVQAKRRSGYKASEDRRLREQRARYRADRDFYCS